MRAMVARTESLGRLSTFNKFFRDLKTKSRCQYGLDPSTLHFYTKFRLVRLFFHLSVSYLSKKMKPQPFHIFDLQRKSKGIFQQKINSVSGLSAKKNAINEKISKISG